MLQKTVYNTCNPYITAEFLTRNQTTDSPYYQINLNSCLTGPIQLIYHGYILQCIHLKYNATFLSLFSQSNFAMYPLLQFGQQVEPGNKQTMKLRFLLFLLQNPKQMMHIFYNRLVASIQSNV